MKDATGFVCWGRPFVGSRVHPARKPPVLFWAVESLFHARGGVGRSIRSML